MDGDGVGLWSCGGVELDAVADSWWDGREWKKKGSLRWTRLA